MILLKNKNAKPSEIKGNYINIKDGYKTQLQKLVFDGRSTQETTNGDQLYDVKDVLTFSSGVTTDNDDWITISCDNTSGTSTKYFDFKTKISENVQPSTTYDLFVEIKSVSGNGTINFVSDQPIGQSVTYSGNSLANLSVGTIKTNFTTKDDFTGCTSFLNSYATFSAGQSGSITFRISVLKANVKTLDNFVYEPFTGVQPSPSPDYPSEIESIEGKNICDVSTSQIGVGWNLANNSARAICNVKVEPNTTYSLSFASISDIDGLYFCEKVNSTDTTIIGNVVRITTNKQITTSSTANYLVIQFNKSNISMSDIETIKLQVEKGSIITGYVPYNTVQYKQIGVQLYNNTSTSDYVNNGITTNFSNNTYTLSGTTDIHWANLTPFLAIDLPVGTYTISINEPQNFRLALRLITIDNEKYDMSIKAGTTSTTFTTTKPMVRTYLFITVATGTTINTSFKFQLQAGDKALPIEEYKETILNINLQGNKLCSLSNGVKDELIVENGRAKIIKNVQEDLLDGVNKKFTSIDLRGSKTFLVCNYANTNIKKAISENEVIPLSNKFRSASLHDTWNSVYLYAISQSHNSHSLQFSFPKTISADLTLDGLNAWLINNNTKVQYQLETPIEIDLGEVTQPKTFEGVNNISNSEDTNMLINYYNAFEFDKILRSGYEIDEQENEIFKKKMANGHRKKIVSSYIDCIIKINLGLLDNKTYQEYKEQLEDGEFQYWSYKYNKYKKANFILTKPSITTEYAYDDDIGIDDLTITLEKSSDVS